MIILITASLSSNRYKASSREDWTFQVNGINIFQHIDLPLRFLMFVNIINKCLLFYLKSERRFHKKQLDPIVPEQANPSNLNPVSKEIISDSVELTVRNGSLFLAHPTHWNKRMTSEYAQCSSRSGFRIFKISREVRVLSTVPVCIV